MMIPHAPVFQDACFPLSKGVFGISALGGHVQHHASSKRNYPPAENHGKLSNVPWWAKMVSPGGYVLP